MRRDGRGVAHLVLPDEVQALPSDAPAAPPQGRYSTRPIPPDAAALADAAQLIREARRPVIVVGHGARGAKAEVIELAERLHAPVLTTFKAKGLVPDTHPLGAGVLGRSGTPVASWLMNESDLLVVVGRLLLQPHRHRAVQADRADRRHPDVDRPVRRRDRPRARRRCARCSTP